jgi:DNA-binding LacI/PurR family transcriptional regulator
MANIKDIAKMAGVSVTTVSRVLNNHPYVSADKKEAVRKAIELCKYQPNINAVHLSIGKTYLIGVVIPFSNHPYFGLLLEGIANEALKSNYKLVLFQTNYEELREAEALAMLKDKQIDVLIICSRICKWDMIDEYLSYGRIILCEDVRGKNVSATFIDHYKTFTKALTYLYDKGHKKIGYCIGRRTRTNSKQRELAYHDFMEKWDLPFEPAYIFDECLHVEDGDRVVQQVKKMSDPPSALLVTSDQVAAGIVTCCRVNNISIPEELAIMGFDNQPIAKMMNITTLEIPLMEMGKNLFRQAVEKADISQKEIFVELIERDTV